MVAGLDPASPRREAEPGRSGRGWIAVILGLAIGWCAFLAYSAAFLTEDPPQLRATAPEDAAGALDFSGPGAAPLQTARRVAYGLDDPRPGEPKPSELGPEKPGTSHEADAPSPPQGSAHAASGAAAGEPQVQAARTGTLPEAAIQATERSPARGTGERPDFVGVWGPTAAACGAPHRRRGYYQATITTGRARAGGTVCTFHDGKRIGAAWVTAADCSDRGKQWSSQVRLVVEGDRLTWSSAKGSASYVRCSRRAGWARALRAAPPPSVP